MVVPLLFGAVCIENGTKDDCRLKNSSFGRSEMFFEDSNDADSVASGSSIRRGRAIRAKAILANPQLTETQILARKFANDALRSSKVRGKLKKLANLSTPSEFSYIPPSVLEENAKSAPKEKSRKNGKAKPRRKSKKKKGKKGDRGGNLSRVKWSTGRRAVKGKKVKNLRGVNYELRTNGNDFVGGRKRRKSEETFNGERMIDRLMKTTTWNPMRKKPGDQGIEYSEYYSDNENLEDSSIYGIDETAKDFRTKRNPNDRQFSSNFQRRNSNYHNYPISRDDYFIYDENLSNFPHSAANFDETPRTSNAKFPDSYSNDDRTIDENIYSPVFSNFHGHKSRRNSAELDENGFPSAERVDNEEPASTFEDGKNKIKDKSGEMTNPIQQSFGKVLETLGINVDDYSEPSNEISEGRQGPDVRRRFDKFGQTEFSSRRESGDFPSRVSSVRYFPASTNGRSPGKSFLEDENSPADGETVSDKPEEAKLSNEFRKTRGKKSKIDEEVGNVTITTNQTKEVANEILNRIIDELAEFKMDRTKKNRKEGEACKLTGSWLSTLAGIKIHMKVANGSINGTFEKCNDQAIHYVLFNATWNIGGKVPFNIGSPFSLLAFDNVTKSLASFVGACKVCQGVDTVQGVWSVAREPKDCRDFQVSTTVFNDVFRKLIVPPANDDNTTMSTTTIGTTGKTK